MSAEGNSWYVKLPDGDVHRVTLDELDAAFQSGDIDENTMVLAAGADEWAKLGDLAGGEDASGGDGDPAKHAVGDQAPMPVPTVAPAPAIGAAPPFGVPAPKPVMAAAPRAVLQAPPAYVPFATSLRPVSVDLSDAGDFEYPRPKKTRWVVGTIGALVVVGAVGFAVQRTAFSSQSSPTTMAAAAMQLPSAPPPPAPEAAPAAPPEVASAQHLPDDLKSKLLEADKQRDVRSKARKAHPSGDAHAAAPKYKSSPVFTTGGNKYDPLNSNL